MVEIDSRLVPAVPDHWPLLTEHLPKMRDRILTSTGVEVPGVRFLRNEGNLDRGVYILMLDEVPLVMGTIEALPGDIPPSNGVDVSAQTTALAQAISVRWMRFSPQPIESLNSVGIPSAGLKSGSHPATGKPGCWVADSFWAQAEAHGVELWPEPISYFVQHVEDFLRRNLADFLGSEGVARWLERCGQQHAGLVKDAVPDTAARLALGRLLRALAQEEVPLVESAMILEEFHRTGRGSDLFVTLRAVRGRLKAQLPGNAVEIERITLPTTTEAALASALTGDGDKRCLAPSLEDTKTMLGELRSLLSANRPGRALVVQNPESRLFVRRLVQFEWPRLPVLAADELLYNAEVAHA
jgi:flagellar biosynthesis component FlhA